MLQLALVTAPTAVVATTTLANALRIILTSPSSSSAAQDDGRYASGHSIANSINNDDDDAGAVDSKVLMVLVFMTATAVTLLLPSSLLLSSFPASLLVRGGQQQQKADDKGYSNSATIPNNTSDTSDGVVHTDINSAFNPNDVGNNSNRNRNVGGVWLRTLLSQIRESTQTHRIVLRRHMTSLEQWWFSHIPSWVRYLVSGNCGNLCFYGCERTLSLAVLDQNYHLLPELAQHWLYDLSVRDSVAFVVAYILHIPGQHLLHAMLVYGYSSIDTPTKYWKTLGGTYSALMTSCVGSTLLHHALIQAWGPQFKTIAFVATLWTFSIFNYFVLGWIVRRTTTTTNNTATTTASSSGTNSILAVPPPTSTNTPFTEEEKRQQPSNVFTTSATTTPADINQNPLYRR